MSEEAEELINGKPASEQLFNICPICRGTGEFGDEGIKCPACQQRWVLPVGVTNQQLEWMAKEFAKNTQPNPKDDE